MKILLRLFWSLLFLVSSAGLLQAKPLVFDDNYELHKDASHYVYLGIGAKIALVKRDTDPPKKKIETGAKNSVADQRKIFEQKSGAASTSSTPPIPQKNKKQTPPLPPKTEAQKKMDFKNSQYDKLPPPQRSSSTSDSYSKLPPPPAKPTRPALPAKTEAQKKMDFSKSQYDKIPAPRKASGGTTSKTAPKKASKGKKS